MRHLLAYFKSPASADWENYFTFRDCKAFFEKERTLGKDSVVRGYDLFVIARVHEDTFHTHTGGGRGGGLRLPLTNTRYSFWREHTESQSGIGADAEWSPLVRNNFTEVIII